jgi:cytochrome P450
MVFAGSFTVSDTLDWMVLFLCEHPDIQEKCYKEISEKLKGRAPTLVSSLFPVIFWPNFIFVGGSSRFVIFGLCDKGNF